MYLLLFRLIIFDDNATYAVTQIFMKTAVKELDRFSDVLLRKWGKFVKAASQLIREINTDYECVLLHDFFSRQSSDAKIFNIFKIYNKWMWIQRRRS